MNHVPAASVLLFLLAALVAPVRAQDADSTAGIGPTGSEIDAAIARALGWIERHPASVDDGGMPELLDEAVGFRVLSSLQSDPEAQATFGTRFRERITALGALPEFTQWVNATPKQLADYYYLVLAAYLMQQAGAPSTQQAAIVTQVQWLLANSPQADPTKRLATALFLERLHVEPVVARSDLLAASRIERIARGNPPVLPQTGVSRQQRRAANLELYALVHEVIGLTDFGFDPVPTWLVEREKPLDSFLAQAVQWAGATADIDLESELLVAARFIRAPLGPVQAQALRHILSSQQADGSWGADTTTMRANKYRHTVFTATAALRCMAANLAQGQGAK